MQLVDGEDLATILHKHGRLETDDAVRIAIGVACALEAAHRSGNVHRDVKPGNILIDQDVKVTDFGIARAVSEASMTVTGTTLGSVHYFSPEQARGDEVTGAVRRLRPGDRPLRDADRAPPVRGRFGGGRGPEAPQRGPAPPDGRTGRARPASTRS